MSAAQSPAAQPRSATSLWSAREREVMQLMVKGLHNRLIAAELPVDFLQKHDGVVIENHLNMVRAIDAKPAVAQATLNALLNSGAIDSVFRCVSGSVAVSAYELEALPLPAPGALKKLDKLVRTNGKPEAIEAECARLFGLDTA